MKRLLITLLLIFIQIASNGQAVTIRPMVNATNTIAEILGISAGERLTVVTLNFYAAFLRGYDWVSLSSRTTLNYMDPTTGESISLPCIALFRGEDKIASNFDTKYRITDFGAIPAHPTFEVAFGEIPSDVSLISISENMKNGFRWDGIHINPRKTYTCPTIGNNATIEWINELVSKSNNPYSGIYESVDSDNNHRLAFLKHPNGIFYLVYISSSEQGYGTTWKIGDVKAELRQSSSETLYKADWYMENKSQNSNCIITFDGALMEVLLEGETHRYIKMVTENEDNNIGSFPNDSQWSGTGFALLDNYIATNYHVVEGAKMIWIQGVGGDFEQRYKAKVLAIDKFNDLALLQVQGAHVSNMNIPYMVKTTTSDVGEDVFVLGYPLTSTMGEEIKLTTGVVSSKTGYQGDVSIYQISAPVQPGNSGGPLFDENGDVIGIVSAKHNDAENVGYAIKASYLRNLMESAMSTNILPQTNKVANQKLSDKVKVLKNFVYYITCSNKE